MAQPVDNGDQCLDVRCVTRQQFTTHGTPFVVHHYDYDHLLEVGTVVLAKATLADRLTTFTFEIDRRCIDEDQSQSREQIPPPLKQRFFNHVLPEPRTQLLVIWLLVRGQWLSQPAH